MYGLDFEREMVRERTQRYVVEAEERRLAKLATGNAPTFRARVARMLFGLAVRVEGNATWGVVWEKLEAPGRS